MTVVEMLIAIFIFILMMGGAAYLLAQIYKNYGFAMEQGLSGLQADSLNRVADRVAKV